MSDVLNEPWVNPWKPTDKVEPHWKEDDIEMVTVVPADEAPQPTQGRSYRELEAQAKVATLRHIPNADEHHNMGVSNLRTALEAAINFLSVPRTGAKAWAKDLSYRDELSPHIDTAVDAINVVLNIIDIHENK